ncbi:hypothetical protein E2C01_076416 [Portunus trituberculatus]|uniref:Uncharacterized protein n=1 Tax=Portunus trituberculatus TaxID=210409 RepID=A0A5B7ID65_PORTR|nr:hypothetical protein [Portunus trituberculatus]
MKELEPLYSPDNLREVQATTAAELCQGEQGRGCEEHPFINPPPGAVWPRGREVCTCEAQKTTYLRNNKAEKSIKVRDAFAKSCHTDFRRLDSGVMSLVLVSPCHSQLAQSRCQEAGSGT